MNTTSVVAGILRHRDTRVWRDTTNWIACLDLKEYSPAKAYFSQKVAKSEESDCVSIALAGITAARKSTRSDDPKTWPTAKTHLSRNPQYVVFTAHAAFVRMLMAWKAHILINELVKTVDKMKINDQLKHTALKQAKDATHLINAAKPWVHGDSIMPPQLDPKYATIIELAALVLAYDAGQLMPDTQEELRKNIALLQLIKEKSTNLALEAAGKWADTYLRVEIAHGWATWQTDPRYKIPPAITPDSVRQYSVLAWVLAEVPATLRPAKAVQRMQFLGRSVKTKTTKINDEVKQLNANSALDCIDFDMTQQVGFVTQATESVVLTTEIITKFLSPPSLVCLP